MIRAFNFAHPSSRTKALRGVVLLVFLVLATLGCASASEVDRLARENEKLERELLELRDRITSPASSMNDATTATTEQPMATTSEPLATTTTLNLLTRDTWDLDELVEDFAADLEQDDDWQTTGPAWLIALAMQSVEERLAELDADADPADWWSGWSATTGLTWRANLLSGCEDEADYWRRVYGLGAIVAASFTDDGASFPTEVVDDALATLQALSADGSSTRATQCLDDALTAQFDFGDG